MAVPVVFIFLLFLWYDGKIAMNEAINIILYIVAFIVTAIVPTYLWNLWLAPYRSMEERLEEATVLNSMTPDEVTILDALRMEDWEKVEVLPLHQAACLWVNIEPHYPIRDLRARTALAQLKGAIKKGKLYCETNKLGLLVHVLVGSNIPWVQDDEAVTRIDLTKYAHHFTQSIPDFLKTVELPSPHSEVEPAPQLTNNE